MDPPERIKRVNDARDCAMKSLELLGVALNAYLDESAPSDRWSEHERAGFKLVCAKSAINEFLDLT